MIIQATNGKEYEVRFEANQDFEIQCDDVVYVFQDYSLGNLESGREEVIFYSYDIVDGERIYKGRHSFTAFENEFNSFLQSEIWTALKNRIVIDFLRKIEFTHTHIESED